MKGKDIGLEKPSSPPGPCIDILQNADMVCPKEVTKENFCTSYMTYKLIF